MQKAQKMSDDEKYAREKNGKRYLARAGKRRADPYRLSTAASFAKIFANMFPAGKTSLNLTKQVVEGEIAYILWSGNSTFYNAPVAADTFVIRDGKIVAQTFAAQLEANETTISPGQTQRILHARSDARSAISPSRVIVGEIEKT